MQLKGSQTFNASNQRIWNILMDPDALARITPGISRLEAIDTDKYKAIANVKIGPVSGSFTGKAELHEKVEPESFTLKISQNSKVGNVAGDVKIALKAISEDQTELAFDGNAQLSGLLARTGQRVLSGVASTLTKQFFKALEEELQQNPA